MPANQVEVMPEVTFEDIDKFGSHEKGRFGEAIGETYLQTAIKSAPELIFDKADGEKRVRIVGRDSRDIISFRELSPDGEESQVRWVPDSQFRVQHNGREVTVFLEVKTSSVDYPPQGQRRVMARMCRNSNSRVLLCSVHFDGTSANLDYRQLRYHDDSTEWVRWTLP